MNKSAELKNTTELVKEILMQCPDARNSDDFLYLKVCERIYPLAVNSMSFRQVLLHRKEFHYPAFESVRRTRQKIQRQYPELAGNSEVEAYRVVNEDAFKAYARKVIV